MKIIDLLNKIANGEEVPKKILYKYKNSDFYEEYRLKWNKKYNGYYTTKDTTPLTYLLADNLWNLNDEVETIEDKKIEKISINDNGTIGFPNGQWTARNMDKAFAIKINKIIDKLNSMEE